MEYAKVYTAKACLLSNLKTASQTLTDLRKEKTAARLLIPAHMLARRPYPP